MQRIGRENWTFTWKVRDLLPYVDAAFDHHFERISWWEAEREVAKAKVRESMEVREQQITGGTRSEVVVDPTLAARLNECESKLAGHRGRRDELQSWRIVLNHTADRASASGHLAEVHLTVADLRYFEVGDHPEPRTG